MAGRVVETTGRTLTTLTVTSTDAAKTLIDDVTNFVGQITTTRDQVENVTGCLITCETQSIRFAWGADPVVDGLGHVIAAGQSLKLTNHKQIIDFRFCSASTGSHGVLMITPETSRV